MSAPVAEGEEELPVAASKGETLVARPSELLDAILAAAREGGAAATLKGIEFNNFGAFFSRAYRENDYLWGRLHGAERMIDLVTSTVDEFSETEKADFKRRAFLAILDEEQERLKANHGLLERVRAEIEERMPAD